MWRRTNFPGQICIHQSKWGIGGWIGLACGIAIALKGKNAKESVFVLLGDGELYEGSVWEAIIFAGEHKLYNLIVILDNYRLCMLDYCKKILDLEPYEEKYKAFKGDIRTVDGHDGRPYNLLSC